MRSVRTSETLVEVGKFDREPPIPDCTARVGLGVFRSSAQKGAKTCLACVTRVAYFSNGNLKYPTFSSRSGRTFDG